MSHTTAAPTVRIHTLPELLALQAVDDGVWRSHCVGDPGWGAVFGGQFLAQAIAAASMDGAEGWLLHSLHALFLRAGDPLEPLDHEVRTLRAGRAFRTVRVQARQSRGVCAEVTLSYQRPEPGPAYQRRCDVDLAALPHPQSLPHVTEQLAGTPLALRQPAWYGTRRGLDLRLVNAAEIAPGPSADDGIRFWLRLDDAVVGSDFTQHEAALAYASDECCSDCLLVPFNRVWNSGEMQLVSLDHVMWFHRPLDLRQWHFVEQRPLVTHGARGTSMAHVWRDDGALVATYAQEALLRIG